MTPIAQDTGGQLFDGILAVQHSSLISWWFSWQRLFPRSGATSRFVWRGKRFQNFLYQYLKLLCNFRILFLVTFKKHRHNFKLNNYVQLHYIYYVQYYYKKGCITAYILVKIIANAHTTYTQVNSSCIQILTCKIKRKLTNTRNRTSEQWLSMMLW
jgi:hypothetical protein